MGRRLFPALLALVLLTGCTVDYDRQDIEEYVAQNYGLSRFQVSRQPREATGEDGYTDYFWTVTLEQGDGLEFQVMDDHYWGMEATVNTLRDNYESTLLEWLWQAFGPDPAMTLRDTGYQGLRQVALTGSFATPEQLEQQFRLLEEFRQFAAGQGYGEEYYFPFRLEMETPLREIMESSQANSYTMDDGDYRGNLTCLTPDMEQAARQKMAYCCLEYQLEGVEWFTSQELEQAVAQSRYRLGICQGEDQPPRLYSDLAASQNGYGVSFGTLYRVLEREGIPVEGTPWNYSFQGPQGDLYQISYDFHDRNPDQPEQPQFYYYLCNGERVWMDYYFYNHFTAAQAQTLTGLPLYIGPAQEARP